MEKKLSLKDIKNGLSRDEMRVIHGGCGVCVRTSSCSTGCASTMDGQSGYCNTCCVA